MFESVFGTIDAMWLCQKLAMIPAILIALTLHEISHGLVAYKLGDNTAKSMGRLSLNPFKHLDLVGTLCLMFVGFGWAKPVPVNPYALRKKPRTGMAWVAAAGPASNLVMALIGGILLLLFNKFTGYGWLYDMTYGNYTAELFLGWFFYMFIQINVVLMIFNLIPVPPLDGSRIVTVFLSPSAALKYNTIERYGTMIMLVCCLIPIGGQTVISLILGTPVSLVSGWIFSLAGM